jgi:hypothetical protein
LAEKNALIAIAEQHPIEAGPAVYNARAILHADFNMEFSWGDSSSVATLTNTSSRFINANATNLIADANVNLYPNPSTGKLNVTATRNNVSTFSVANVFGIILAKGEFTYTTELDLSNLPKGTYIITISNTKTGEQTKKSLILCN